MAHLHNVNLTTQQYHPELYVITVYRLLAYKLSRI